MPLALRSHVTKASFKQRVGILLMPKIDRAHKHYLTREIWDETHLREILYGTLIFQQSSMICIGRPVGGHTLALQHGGQNYLLLISCWMFYSFAQTCCKRYYIIFSIFSLKFKCKIWIQKEVMSYFGHVTSYELTYFKEMVRVWKTVLFIIVFRRKNHMTFIFIKTMSHDLLRQMAYLMYVNLTFGKFALKLFNVNFPRVVNAHR